MKPDEQIHLGVVLANGLMFSHPTMCKLSHEMPLHRKIEGLESVEYSAAIAINLLCMERYFERDKINEAIGSKLMK